MLQEEDGVEVRLALSCQLGITSTNDSSAASREPDGSGTKQLNYTGFHSNFGSLIALQERWQVKWLLLHPHLQERSNLFRRS